MRLFLVVAILLSTISPAYAYLDPGSGSMLLYALASIGGMLAYSARGLFHRTVNFFIGKGSGNSQDLKGMNLGVYSEGNQYWNVLSPVIDSLAVKGVKCFYLTSDKNDEGLLHPSPLVTARYIGRDSISAAVLNHLTANLVVMTTPQLGIFKLKRSKNVQHYAQLLHAPTDSLNYKRFAFDHYDSVMCSGPHQERSIRKLEEIRGTAAKELYQTGMTYYDVMLKDILDFDLKVSNKSVLFAPTWGKNSLLDRYGSACIRPLLDSGVEVILRPHPQSYLSQPGMMKKIEDELTLYPNLTIDRAVSAIHSMAISDVLISDLSGIIFDYAFVFAKPVIIIDSAIDRHGLEAEYVDSEIWEISVREELGRLVTQDDLPLLPSIVGDVLQSGTASDLEEFRRKSLYNFGRAGETAAGQLIEILGRQVSSVAGHSNGILAGSYLD